MTHLSHNAQKIESHIEKWERGGLFVNRGNEHRAAIALAREDPDSLEQLIFSLPKSEQDLRLKLMELGGHGGSCAKRHNQHWMFFHERLRQRWDELSEMEQTILNWYQAKHGW